MGGIALLLLRRFSYSHCFPEILTPCVQIPELDKIVRCCTHFVFCCFFSKILYTFCCLVTIHCFKCLGICICSLC